MMSSDEGEQSSPVLPRDSDRGSSVSSELQDEYEELLRFAVVTPRYEPSVPSQLLNTSQLSASGRNSRVMDARSPLPAESGRHSARGVTSAWTTPPLQEPSAQTQDSEGEEVAIGSVVSERESERPQTASERSGPNSPDPLITVVTEMFISEENMSKMGNILDIWSNNLKVNVLTELRKWKLAFVEQHRLELRKEKEKHAAHVAGLNADMDSLKTLLHTYQISSQRKDEVIVNLSHAVDRQRERLELMRTFTHWRLQHCAAREEVQGGRLAEQHYQLQLKRKVWAGWHSLIQSRWKDRVERACRARAEDVCVQLSADYEAKMAEHAEALQKAQAEIQRLHVERERYEDAMKKAFMRGVCALNMEAMSMFQGGDGRLEQHDAPPPRDEPGSSSLANLHPGPASSARLSPVIVESAVQPAFSRSDAEDTSQFTCLFGSSSAAPKAEPLPSTTVLNSLLPPGGSADSHRQASGTRVVTSVQQKASKTVTARLTGRSDVAKAGRPAGSLHVMGVAPPMSSVVVERHHPVTQLTVSQATAAKFPRAPPQNQGITSKSSSSHHHRGHAGIHIHSIKVVE